MIKQINDAIDPVLKRSRLVLVFLLIALVLKHISFFEAAKYVAAFAWCISAFVGMKAMFTNGETTALMWFRTIGELLFLVSLVSCFILIFLQPQTLKLFVGFGYVMIAGILIITRVDFCEKNTPKISSS